MELSSISSLSYADSDTGDTAIRPQASFGDVAQARRFVVIKGRLLGLDNVMICATAYFVSLLLSNFAWCMKRTGAKENAVQVLCDKVQRKL